MPNEKPISYTPEQIKAAAEYCKNVGVCNDCPLECANADEWSCATLARRLLTLESEAADLRARLAESEKREKAAVADLQNINSLESVCCICKHLDIDTDKYCSKCDSYSKFEWRAN